MGKVVRDQGGVQVEVYALGGACLTKRVHVALPDSVQKFSQLIKIYRFFSTSRDGLADLRLPGPVQRTAARALFAGAILASGLVAVAPSAHAAGEETEFQAAFEALQGAPTNPKNIWRYVRAAKAVGDYESAIGVLEPILLIDADQQVIRSEVGLLYYMLGSYSTARRHLSAALESGELSEKRAKIVRRALNASRDRDLRNRLRAQVTAGARYQSNPTAAPATDTVTLGGTDLVLTDEIAADGDGNVFVSGWMKHAFDFDMQNELALETWGSFYATRQFDATQTNVATASLEPGLSVRPLRHSARWLKVRPHLYGNVLAIEDDLYALSYGGGINTLMTFENGIGAEATYQYRQRDFKDSDERLQADERDGHEHHYRVRLSLPLPARFALDLKPYAIRTDADEAHLDSWSYTASGSLIKHYQPPFDMGHTYWRAWVRLDRVFRNFDDPDAAVSAVEARKDRRWIVSAGNVSNIAQNLDLNLQYSFNEQTSNFQQYEYINHAGTVSLSYTF